MVLVNPEGAWSEIKAQCVYECENEILRRFEDQLRTTIYIEAEIQDDTTIDAAFDIGWKVDNGDYSVDIKDMK